MISDSEMTLNAAPCDLNLTWVVSGRSVPRMLTVSPNLPEVRQGFHDDPSPTDRLKTVPQLLLSQPVPLPPKAVVP